MGSWLLKQLKPKHEKESLGRAGFTRYLDILFVTRVQNNCTFLRLSTKHLSVLGILEKTLNFPLDLWCPDSLTSRQLVISLTCLNLCTEENDSYHDHRKGYQEPFNTFSNVITEVYLVMVLQVHIPNLVYCIGLLIFGSDRSPVNANLRSFVCVSVR